MSRRPLLAAMSLSALIMTAAGCASSAAEADVEQSSAPTKFEITGTMAVQAYDYDGPDGCTTGKGYSDIAQGAQVTVTDEKGTTIALGSVGAPTADKTHADCVYSFTVADVPRGKKFYGVEVSHRGVLQYTEEQAREALALKLG